MLWLRANIGRSVYSYCAAVAVSRTAYFFGYWGSSVYVLDTVSLCGTEWAPTGRYKATWLSGHTAVAVGDVAYLWGGQGSIDGPPLCAFNLGTRRWSRPRVSGTVPKRRQGHSACVLGSVMFIYGGITGTAKEMYLTQLYKLDTATMVWTLTDTRGTPPPWFDTCLGHSAAVIGRKMFVVTGCGRYFDSGSAVITAYDTETDTWTAAQQLPVPPRDRIHSAFAHNGELYIYGGESLYGRHHLHDMWRFNPKTFSWKEVRPKAPTKTPGSCCVVSGDRVIHYGGLNANCLFVLDLSPSLKTLSMLAVAERGLDRSELPHNLRRELEAMVTAQPAKRRFLYDTFTDVGHYWQKAKRRFL